jgi:hypothetical protein
MSRCSGPRTTRPATATGRGVSPRLQARSSAGNNRPLHHAQVHAANANASSSHRQAPLSDERNRVTSEPATANAAPPSSPPPSHGSHPAGNAREAARDVPTADPTATTIATAAKAGRGGIASRGGDSGSSEQLRSHAPIRWIATTSPPPLCLFSLAAGPVWLCQPVLGWFACASPSWAGLPAPARPGLVCLCQPVLGWFGCASRSCAGLVAPARPGLVWVRQPFLGLFG